MTNLHQCLGLYTIVRWWLIATQNRTQSVRLMISIVRQDITVMWTNEVVLRTNRIYMKLKLSCFAGKRHPYWYKSSFEME